MQGFGWGGTQSIQAMRFRTLNTTTPPKRTIGATCGRRILDSGGWFGWGGQFGGGGRYVVEPGDEGLDAQVDHPLARIRHQLRCVGHAHAHLEKWLGVEG